MLPPMKRKLTRWPHDEAWPRRSAPGLSLQTGRGRSAAPGLNVHGKKPPGRRLRAGSDQAAHKCFARDTARQCPPERASFFRAPPRGARRMQQRQELRPGLLRQVARKRAVFDAGGSVQPRHEGRFTDAARPCLMELPRHASRTLPQAAAGGVLACRWGVGLARIRTQAGEAVTRGYRVGQSPFGKFVPWRPWLVVNPGRGMAAPWASWRQPCGENNFPCAARIPRGTNSFRLQVLHCVAAAARCRQPVPRLTDHNKDAMGATLPTRKENHHG